MPFNGSGLFTQLHNWVTDKANNVLVTASRFQTTYDDMATGLSNCMTRDGQSPPTADIPMGGFQLNELADGTAADDAATVGQIPALAGSGSYFNAGNSGAALSIDWTDGVNQQLTLTANTTLTLGDGVTPGWYQLKIIQDGTGGRTITWAGTNYSASRWIGNGSAPVLSPVIAAVEMVALFWDGTQWFQIHQGIVGRKSVYMAKYQRATSDQTIATGVTATIVFNSADTDTYSELNSGTGVFTPQVRGLYMLQATLLVSVANAGNILPSPVVGGTSTSNTTYLATTGQVFMIPVTLLQLVALGGTAYVQINNQTAGNLTVKVGSLCQITRLSDYN